MSAHTEYAVRVKSTTDCVKQLAISLLEQGLCDANAPKELNDLLCDDGAMLKQFLVNNIIKAESAKTAKNTTGLVEAFVRWDDRHPDRFERTNCRSHKDTPTAGLL